MKTKIVDNGLARENLQRDITRALSGVWGSTLESDEQTRLDLGRASITVVQGGKKIMNKSAQDALAIVVLEDGTTSITVVPKDSETSTTNTIKLAMMLARS